jgi:adenosylcobinamide-GDP ribazoletransferase
MSAPDSNQIQQPSSRRRWFDDLRLALMLLTRLPLPAGTPPPGQNMARAAWIFPFVGALIGLGAGVVFLIANRLGLGIASATLLAIGWQVLITGALHEDGLADTADGFGGGRDREHKLAIMRDSRIGTYGVVALLLVFSLRFAAIEELASNLLSLTDEIDETVSHTGAIMIALTVAGAVSRSAMTLVWYILPPAREDGLAVSGGKVPLASLIVSLGFSVLIALILLPGFGFAVALAVPLVLALGMALLAWRQIGGHTGDVLGATQQLAEITVLLSISAVTLAV